MNNNWSDNIIVIQEEKSSVEMDRAFFDVHYLQN